MAVLTVARVVSRLVVPAGTDPNAGGVNMLDNGGFELSIAGVASFNRCAPSQSGAAARYGSRSLLATANVTGQTFGPRIQRANGNNILIIGGQPYTIAASVLAASAASVVPGEVDIRWFDSTGSGTSISTGYISDSGSGPMTPQLTWGRWTITGNAPANAAYCLIWFAFGGVGTTAGDGVFIDGVQLEPGSTASDYQDTNA